MVMDNICDSFENELNTALSAMRNSRTKLRGKFNELDNKLDDMVGVDDLADIGNDLQNETNEIERNISDKIESMKDYTGSCLNGIAKSINDIRNNANSVIGEMFKLDQSPEWGSLSNALGGMNNLLDKMGVSSIIKTIDESLGCLSDADCLQMDKIQGIMDEINAFEQEFSLNTAGELDIESYLDVKDLGGLKSSIITLNESIKQGGSEIKKLIKDKGGLKVPFDLW